ncbi:MAG: DNA recombination protein RmuC, partial [Hallella bergensis]
MEIVYLIIGVLIGFTLAFLWQQNKKKGIEADLMLARQQNENMMKVQGELQTKADAMSDELKSFQSQLTQAKVMLSSLETQLDAERKQHGEEAEQRREQEQKLEAERQKQFDAQIETVKEQFHNLATKVLD